MRSQKTYFVIGRVQAEGVSKALDIAIRKHNDKNPENKFAVLGRYAGAGKYPSGEMPESVTWVQDIPQGRDYVPASMLNFTREHHGRAIFFNGSDFTAEMAYGAPESRIPHALQEPRKGKMAEVAETSETDSQFRNLDQFVEEVMEKTGEDRFFRTDEEKQSILREGIDLQELKAEMATLKLDSEAKIKGREKS